MAQLCKIMTKLNKNITRYSNFLKSDAKICLDKTKICKVMPCQGMAKHGQGMVKNGQVRTKFARYLWHSFICRYCIQTYDKVMENYAIGCGQVTKKCRKAE